MGDALDDYEDMIDSTPGFGRKRPMHKPMTREQYDEAKAGCFQLDGPDSECHCHRYLPAALALIAEDTRRIDSLLGVIALASSKAVISFTAAEVEAQERVRAFWGEG